MEAEYVWRNSTTHKINRRGATLTHAHYLTTTVPQKQTLRGGTTIGCARMEPQRRQGTPEDDGRLNLYAMVSRATELSDMLLTQNTTQSITRTRATCINAPIVGTLQRTNEQ